MLSEVAEQERTVDALPAGWHTIHLGDVVDTLVAGVSVNADNRKIGVGEIGVLKTSCVSGGQFVADEHKAVLANEVSRVRTPVKAGSIIISRMNTPALVGANAFVDQDHPDLFLPDRLWQLRTNASTDCRWLSYFIQTATFRLFIDDIATGTSGSMKNISKERLLRLPLTLPPLDEQRRIAEVIRSVDEAIAANRALMGAGGNGDTGALLSLKAALMSDLLSGKVRVPA
ncbi:restriction endonuclease subunit S [Blastomonas fulva]|uniref:restriction endonuclease subunit S n=1 Tax=Blastomonas fulva TaxID=1550728 RepID=UPI003F70481C